MSASCAIRSRDFVEGPRLTLPALAQGFFGEAAQFFRRARQGLLPGSLIFQRLDDLGGDGVLLLAGQGSLSTEDSQRGRLEAGATLLA